MKLCNKCGLDKPLTEFYKSWKKNGSLHGSCKDCFKKKWWNNWRKNSKSYYENNIKWSNKTIRNLGLSQDFFVNELKESKWICSICKVKSKLVVDHCHIKNKYRWLICRDCNLWLWNFKDNIDYIKSAIEYLEKNS